MSSGTESNLKFAIIVGNIPNVVTTEMITIYFQQRRHGGDDIIHVVYPYASPGNALVIFYNNAVEDTITQHTHTLDHQKLTIQTLRIDNAEVKKFGEDICSTVKATLTRSLTQNSDFMKFIGQEISKTFDVEFRREPEDTFIIGNLNNVNRACKQIQSIYKKTSFNENIDLLDRMKDGNLLVEDEKNDFKYPSNGLEADQSEFQDAFEISMGIYDRMKLLFSTKIEDMEDGRGEFMRVKPPSSSVATKLQIKISPYYDVNVMKDEVAQLYEQTAFGQNEEQVIQLSPSYHTEHLVEQLNKVSGRGANASLEDDGRIVIKGLKDAVVIAKKYLKEFLKIGVICRSNSYENPDDSKQSGPKHKVPSTVMSDSSRDLMKINIRGFTIHIYQQDITILKVDAIVNAANSRLVHGGGVAAAILKGAGQSLQVECEQYLHNHGELCVGDVITTRAGKLPCQLVFHAVGPDARLCSNTNTFSQMLCDTFYMCLQKATEIKVGTLAIPLISSGIFGGNKELCAEMLYHALDTFTKNNDSNHCTLQQIHLVNFDEATTNVVRKVFVDISKQCIAAENTTSSKFDQPSLDDHDKNMPLTKSKPQVTAGDQSEDNANMNTSSYQNRIMTRQSKQQRNENNRTPGDQTQELGKKSNTQDSSNDLHRVDQKNDSPKLNGSSVAALKATKKSKAANSSLHQVRQPLGTMRTTTIGVSLPGYEAYDTIRISYVFEPGNQQHTDPNPGCKYSGANIGAYLPDSPEGKRVCRLLKKAFDSGLTYRIDQKSSYLGEVVPCGIPHKYNINNSHKQQDGYPDPDYLQRVIKYLAGIGISDESTV